MVNKGRKHKRGDRGSTEEELATPKRANMAETEALEKEESSTETPLEMSQEPSLGDLREMLVDIQITVNNILLENKRISGEVMELKSTVYKQKAELSAIKESLDLTTKQCANAEKELAAVRNQLAEKEEEIAELYYLQDRLEQYTRKNSLEFHGVPESAYSSPEEVVLKISEALEVPVGPQDIEISHKLSNKGNKAIIAKFISHKVKSNLYRARTKLKNIRMTDLFPGSSYATTTEANRIYINENLTSYRKRIMKKANEKRRDGELLSVWSLDGTIFVKTSPAGRPIKISEPEDLDHL